VPQRALRKYPWLVLADGATAQGLDSRLLRRLNALGNKLQKQITITSGYRTREKQQELWDNAERYGLIRGKTVARPGSSRHESGLAVDASVDGKPLGSLGAKVLASVGLQAPVPGDMVHVELAGSRKQTAATTEPPAAQEPASPEFDQDTYNQRVSAATPNTQTPVSPELPTAGLAPPGSVDIPYSPRRWAAETWQTLAVQPMASPDTLKLAERAKVLLA
jgi:hypothetical protein